MKKEDVDKFRENLNNDIDKIIENNECDEENNECGEENIKPSYIFLTVSILCLIIVFGLLKGLCIFGFVTGCIWFYVDEIKPSKSSKKKENKDQFLTEDEFEDAFK